MQAENISEVISYLEEIIHSSESEQSPMGYFAALYRKVTVRVKEGIAEGYFEDGKRMEELDVKFANRYLEAYSQFLNNEKPTASWEVAFSKSRRYWPIVLQHLLLGMNAYINLDLGIAAARNSPGEKINNLKGDFDKINEILSSLVEEVENELAEIWPTLKFLLKIAGRVDNFLAEFSMEIARDGAWKFATELALLNLDQQAIAINERDKKIVQTAHIVARPGFIISTIFKIIRIGEKGKVAGRIALLARKHYKSKSQ